MRVALFVLFLSTSAMAQDPVILFPVLNHTADRTTTGGSYYDTVVNCARWYNGTAYTPCPVIQSQLDSAIASESSARNSAISTALAPYATSSSVTSALANYSTTSAMNTAISSATTGLASTSAMNTAIANATSGLASAAAVSSAISTATAPLATSASVTSAVAAEATLRANADTAEATARANADTAEVTARNAAIAAAINTANQRVCATATLSGISIPLTGISSEVSVSLPGAPVGTSCRVGLANFNPLGAKPVVVVATASTGTLRFEGNSGLLSGVINIPNGTARICCDL